VLCKPASTAAAVLPFLLPQTLRSCFKRPIEPRYCLCFLVGRFVVTGSKKELSVLVCPSSLPKAVLGLPGTLGGGRRRQTIILKATGPEAGAGTEPDCLRSSTRNEGDDIFSSRKFCPEGPTLELSASNGPKMTRPAMSKYDNGRRYGRSFSAIELIGASSRSIGRRIRSMTQRGSPDRF